MAGGIAKDGMPCAVSHSTDFRAVTLVLIASVLNVAIAGLILNLAAFLAIFVNI